MFTASYPSGWRPGGGKDLLEEPEIDQDLKRKTDRPARSLPRWQKNSVEGLSEDLKAALIKKFGTVEQAWGEIDSNRDGLLQFDEFVRACNRVQFFGNLRKIFEKLSRGGAAIKPEVLDLTLPADWTSRGLQESSGADRTFVAPDAPRYPSKNRSRRSSKESSAQADDITPQHGSAQTMGEVSDLLQRPQARAPPPCDPKSFKAALLKKFGKLEYAWPELDTNGSGDLEFHEFVQACRKIQFQGSLRKIFDGLAKGQDRLTPQSLDPGLPALLGKVHDKEELVGGRRNSASRSVSASPERSREPSGGQQFQHGTMTSAQTAGEVNLLLQRSDSKVGPPCDAKAFKAALFK
jgi:hypothetical protein